jgi:hypothetical protein
MGYTINDNDTRHNGWTNYATWRVNLEIFDGIDSGYFRSEVRTSDVYDLSKRLQEFAENIIDDSGEGLAVDYARAFLADVNFYEIAQHMIDAAKADAA